MTPQQIFGNGYDFLDIPNNALFRFYCLSGIEAVTTTQRSKTRIIAGCGFPIHKNMQSSPELNRTYLTARNFEDILPFHSDIGWKEEKIIIIKTNGFWGVSCH